jgi:hypothetical protein
MTNGIVRIAAMATSLFAVHAFAADYRAPRLPDGTPDLQGMWTNATATPVERAQELGQRRAFTAEEAAAISKAAVAAVEADAEPSDPDKKIEAIASVIIEPADGRIPPLTAAAEQRTAARARNANDGPEGRALGERCLLSFGSASGPPMLPVMYNSYYQIVQSPGYVMILVEMVHDARIIRIQDRHTPGGIRKWMGDSVGHWEGDTLVVETRNFRPEQSFRGSSENAVVTERFTRVANDTIIYRFTVDDPATFTSSFTGELPFVTVDANIYEYACHEGNYALPSILSGAREQEKAQRTGRTAE